MVMWLRQSTAAKVIVGPFVDETDGFTAETGLTLAAMDDAELVKHGSASVVDISGRTFTHIQGGQYALDLSTSDTDTLGRVRIFFRDAGTARPLAMDFMVVPAQVYDSLIAYTAQLGVDVIAVSGDSTAADNLEAGLEGVVTGTVSTGSTTTVVTTGLSETTDDHYNGRVIVFRSGNLAGQAAAISDYNGSTKALTVSTLTEAPGNGDTFVIV